MGVEFSQAFVCVSVFQHDNSKIDAASFTKCHINVPWSVLEIHLFWSQKVTSHKTSASVGLCTLVSATSSSWIMALSFDLHRRGRQTWHCLIKVPATVTVYRDHHRTLFLLPGIISLLIMCVGIIRNNTLVDGRARAESNPGHWARHALLHMAVESCRRSFSSKVIVSARRHTHTPYRLLYHDH